MSYLNTRYFFAPNFSECEFSRTLLSSTMSFLSEFLYLTPASFSPFLFPSLLMSLMQQKNAPDVKTKFKPEYDYIIVGGGSAGSVVASRLSEESCVDVLLLEAGKRPPTLTDVPAYSLLFWFSDVDWAFKTVPQKNTAREFVNRQVQWPSGKGLGGSSIFNGMLYVRGNMKDYNDWEAQGAEGWSYDDVLRYFLKLENNMNQEYVETEFHNDGGPVTFEQPRYSPELKQRILEAGKSLGFEKVDSNGAEQTGLYEHQSNLRNQQRVSVAKAYLVPAEHRGNLDIVAEAFVKKVVIENGRATGVIFDFEGEEHLVKAKREVIMSAGAVNSAKLLKLSGIGPREELEKFGIEVVADLPVGQNLQDHIGTFVNFELDPNQPTILAKISASESVSQYINNRTGPLTTTEGILSAAFLNGNSNDSVFPNYQLYFVEALGFIAQIVLPLTSEAFTKVYAPYLLKPMFLCVSSNLHPGSRGTITLNSADPYDPALIDPNYLDDPKDIDDIVQGMKTCNRLADTDVMKKIGVKPVKYTFTPCEEFPVNSDSYLECQVRSAVFSFNHQSGTAKMGNKCDPTTVVDPKLRVKGIKGLRVVDASVMPLVPSGNTNIPTIMVAEKASDIIKASIFCEGGKPEEEPESAEC